MFNDSRLTSSRGALQVSTFSWVSKKISLPSSDPSEDGELLREEIFSVIRRTCWAFSCPGNKSSVLASKNLTSWKYIGNSSASGRTTNCCVLIFEVYLKKSRGICRHSMRRISFRKGNMSNDIQKGFQNLIGEINAQQGNATFYLESVKRGEHLNSNLITLTVTLRCF